MSAIAWATVKSAIHSWATTTSGLSADRVIFALQNAVRPEGVTQAWCSLWISSLSDLGVTSVTVVDNPTPTPGAELVREVRGIVELWVTVTVYGAMPDNNTVVADALESHALLQDMVSALRDPAVVESVFHAARINVLDFDRITSVGLEFAAANIEPQSLTTVRFLVETLRTSTLTYIEHVNAELHVIKDDDSVKTFPVSYDLEP